MGNARSRIRTGDLLLIWENPVQGTAYKAAALPLSYPGARVY